MINSNFSEETIQFESLFHGSFIHQKVADTNKYILLLHGFSSHAQHMMKWFTQPLSKNYNLLSINAPYPIAVKKDGKYKMYYSWYFYNPDNKQYLIDYSICQSYVYNLIKKLGISQNPKSIIGFSQGGYASVHIAQNLLNIHKIVGIGCQYKIDNPVFSSLTKVYSAHSSNDEVVDLNKAHQCFHKIPPQNQGEFKIFDNCGHLPNKDILHWASKAAKF